MGQSMPDETPPNPTKLCVIIASTTDADQLMHELVSHEMQATKVASSGGFLRRGNATILTGVPDDRVDELIAIVRHECRARREIMPLDTLPFDPSGGLGMPIEVRVGGAIVFVLDVTRFERV
jgi:uncharacterized protein YaaQ